MNFGAPSIGILPMINLSPSTSEGLTINREGDKLRTARFTLNSIKSYKEWLVNRDNGWMSHGDFELWDLWLRHQRNCTEVSNAMNVKLDMLKVTNKHLLPRVPTDFSTPMHASASGWWCDPNVSWSKVMLGIEPINNATDGSLAVDLGHWDPNNPDEKEESEVYKQAFSRRK